MQNNGHLNFFISKFFFVEKKKKEKKTATFINHLIFGRVEEKIKQNKKITISRNALSS